MDQELISKMTSKQNLTSTVVFGKGSLGLELISRKPRKETIENRILRKKKKKLEINEKIKKEIENELRLSIREITMREIFEGIDLDSTGYISTINIYKTFIYNETGALDILKESVPKLYTLCLTPLIFSKLMLTFDKKMNFDHELNKMVVENQGQISWLQFYEWTLKICNEQVLNPISKLKLQKEQELERKKEKELEQKNKFEITGGKYSSTLFQTSFIAFVAISSI